MSSRDAVARDVAAVLSYFLVAIAIFELNRLRVCAVVPNEDLGHSGVAMGSSCGAFVATIESNVPIFDSVLAC